MNKNQKGNGRARDSKGRFVSLAAVYSVKHNTVDLEKTYEEKMKEWEEQGLAKSDNFFRSFKYRPEAFRIPSSYYYTPEEVKIKLGGYDNYVLKMSELTEVDLEEPESILSVAKLESTRDDRHYYFKNALYDHEGLTLVKLGKLNKDFDFYLPKTAAPKDTESLFQGVVAKRKLKDLVIDTYYKLDFNKSIRTHYTLNSKLDEDSPIYICRYHSSPMSIFGHDNVSAVIFKKTDFDEDGDRIILTRPEPIYVLIKQDYGFLAIDLVDKEVQPYPIGKLDELANLPNLMIPEGMLRQLARVELSDSKGTLSFLEPSAPRQECTMQPVGFNTRPEQPLGFGIRLNLGLHIPIEILAIDEVNDYKRSIKTYRLGEFRAPRKEGEITEIDDFNIDSGHFYLATGPKDLWILIDENIDKIYFYNVHDRKIVDWCLTTTFDFLNLLNRFSSVLLTDETKGDLIEAMNNIRRNYYSKGIVSDENNYGLTGFLDKL